MSATNRRTTKRFASLIVTILLIVATNLGISYTENSTVAKTGIAYPLPPRPKTGIAYPLPPRPKTGIAYPLPPRPKTGIAYPLPPRPRTGIAYPLPPRP